MNAHPHLLLPHNSLPPFFALSINELTPPHPPSRSSSLPLSLAFKHIEGSQSAVRPLIRSGLHQKVTNVPVLVIHLRGGGREGGREGCLWFLEQISFSRWKRREREIYLSENGGWGKGSEGGREGGTLTISERRAHVRLNKPAMMQRI